MRAALGNHSRAATDQPLHAAAAIGANSDWRIRHLLAPLEMVAASCALVFIGRHGYTSPEVDSSYIVRRFGKATNAGPLVSGVRKQRPREQGNGKEASSFSLQATCSLPLARRDGLAMAAGVGSSSSLKRHPHCLGQRNTRGRVSQYELWDTDPYTDRDFTTSKRPFRRRKGDSKYR